MKITIILLSIIFAVSFPSLAFSGPHIDDETRSLLQVAKKSNWYEVRIFEGIIGYRVKKLIVLGETHQKNEEAYHLGKKIVERFSFSGFEYQFQNFWILGDSYEKLPTQDEIIAEIKEKSEVYSGVSGSDDEYNSSVVSLVQKESGHKFWLEKDHYPSFGANMMIAYPMGIATVLLASIGQYIVSHFLPKETYEKYYEIFGKWVYRGAGAAILHPLMMATGLWSIMQYSSKYSWGWLVHPLNGMITERDRSMVKNIMLEWQNYPDEDVMFIIVGIGHVKAGALEYFLHEKGFASLTKW